MNFNAGAKGGRGNMHHTDDGDARTMSCSKVHGMASELEERGERDGERYRPTAAAAVCMCLQGAHPSVRQMILLMLTMLRHRRTHPETSIVPPPSPAISGGSVTFLLQETPPECIVRVITEMRRMA